MSRTSWNKPKRKDRMTPKQNKEFILWLMEIGQCQICGSPDIDIPHHVGIGINRNDFDRILLCVGCHRKIHNSLFTWHITPDFDEMKFIAKQNRENFTQQ